MVSTKRLRTHGLARVPYPAAIYEAVRRAAGSWQRFCHLPYGDKERFIYADEGNLSESGYERKTRHGTTLDLKETFHATLKDMPTLESATNGAGSIVPGQFLEDARHVLDSLTPFVIELAQAIERECGLAGLTAEVLAGRSNWFLRYLHYFGDRVAGASIASAHVDKTGFTLHLHETDSGLQYLALPGPDVEEPCWHEMPVTKNETVVIPGMQLQHRSDGQLKALCHRVTANAKTAAAGRFSMVCFVPLLDTPVFNKVSLGRLQDYPPGFNYRMPNTEFRKLFT